MNVFSFDILAFTQYSFLWILFWAVVSIKSKWQHLFIPRLYDLKRELVTVQVFQLFPSSSHFSVVMYLIHVRYQDCATKHVSERTVDDMWHLNSRAIKKGEILSQNVFLCGEQAKVNHQGLPLHLLSVFLSFRLSVFLSFCHFVFPNESIKVSLSIHFQQVWVWSSLRIPFPRSLDKTLKSYSL